MKNFILGIWWLIKRTPGTYFVLALLSLLIINKDILQNGITTRQINNLIPASYDVLFKIKNQSFSKNEQLLKRYTRYYKDIAEFQPQMADAHSMLGYCYYYQGNDAKALISYEKAYTLKPEVFWFSYNLGLIHLQNKNFKDAVFYFKQALSSDPNQTLLFVKSSRMIYGDILKKSNKDTAYLISQLNRGRTNLLELIKTLQDNQSPDQLINKFNVQMF